MRSTQHTLGTALESSDDEFELTGSASGAETQNEVEEMELAAQLLEITDDFELDQFIGRQLQAAARAAGSAIPSPVLEPLSRALKQTLRHTLRIVGGGGETLASNPSGHADPSLAVGANTFGLELEGLSPEDQEFELARRFVRLTRSAGRRAPRFARRLPPRAAVRRTLVAAARRHAPGLLRRRRRRRPRLLVPVPVVYPEPVPLAAPALEPVMEPEPNADQTPAPEPDADSSATADSNVNGDATNADPEPEPATEEISTPETCHCGGSCPRCRRRRSGRWVRTGTQIILQDV